MGDKSKFALRLKYLSEDRDRHGNWRTFVRVPGQPKVRIRHPVGSPEFMAQYQAAIEGRIAATKKTLRQSAPKGSFGWLCDAYISSQEFKILDRTTRRIRSNTLDKISEKHKLKPVAQLEVRHIQQLRDAYSTRIEAANSIIKILRDLFRWGVQLGYVRNNPARDVPLLHNGSQGIHTWTEDEIAQYREKHEIGTQARLAMEIMLCLGQRKSDAVVLGRQHIKNGKFHFIQAKNRSRHPVELKIPIVPALQECIDRVPPTQIQFLLTEFGKPFTANGFGNKFRKWCDEAGLPNCSSHGLRKATATLLAEMGCTEQQIQAVTGHRTSKQVSLYTRAASQERLAKQAFEKVGEHLLGRQNVPPKKAVASSGTNSSPKPLNR